MSDTLYFLLLGGYKISSTIKNILIGTVASILEGKFLMREDDEDCVFVPGLGITETQREL